MRYKIELRVFAESEITGASVELCPDGLVEVYDSDAAFYRSIRMICEQGWGVKAKQLRHAFFNKLCFENDVVTRIIPHKTCIAPNSGGNQKNAPPTAATPN